MDASSLGCYGDAGDASNTRPGATPPTQVTMMTSSGSGTTHRDHPTAHDEESGFQGVSAERRVLTGSDLNKPEVEEIRDRKSREPVERAGDLIIDLTLPTHACVEQRVHHPDGTKEGRTSGGKLTTSGAKRRVVSVADVANAIIETHVKQPAPVTGGHRTLPAGSEVIPPTGGVQTATGSIHAYSRGGEMPAHATCGEQAEPTSNRQTGVTGRFETPPTGGQETERANERRESDTQEPMETCETEQPAEGAEEKVMEEDVHEDVRTQEEKHTKIKKPDKGEKEEAKENNVDQQRFQENKKDDNKDQGEDTEARDKKIEEEASERERKLKKLVQAMREKIQPEKIKNHLMKKKTEADNKNQETEAREEKKTDNETEELRAEPEDGSMSQEERLSEEDISPKALQVYHVFSQTLNKYYSTQTEEGATRAAEIKWEEEEEKEEKEEKEEGELDSDEGSEEDTINELRDEDEVVDKDLMDIAEKVSEKTEEIKSPLSQLPDLEEEERNRQKDEETNTEEEEEDTESHRTAEITEEVEESGGEDEQEENTKKQEIEEDSEKTKEAPEEEDHRGPVEQNDVTVDLTGDLIDDVIPDAAETMEKTQEETVETCEKVDEVEERDDVRDEEATIEPVEETDQEEEKTTRGPEGSTTPTRDDSSGHVAHSAHLEPVGSVRHVSQDALPVESGSSGAEPRDTCGDDAGPEGHEKQDVDSRSITGDPATEGPGVPGEQSPARPGQPGPAPWDPATLPGETRPTPPGTEAPSPRDPPPLPPDTARAKRLLMDLQLYASPIARVPAGAARPGRRLSPIPRGRPSCGPAGPGASGLGPAGEPGLSTTGSALSGSAGGPVGPTTDTSVPRTPAAPQGVRWKTPSVPSDFQAAFIQSLKRPDAYPFQRVSGGPRPTSGTRDSDRKSTPRDLTESTDDDVITAGREFPKETPEVRTSSPEVEEATTTEETRKACESLVSVSPEPEVIEPETPLPEVQEPEASVSPDVPEAGTEVDVRTTEEGAAVREEQEEPAETVKITEEDIGRMFGSDVDELLEKVEGEPKKHKDEERSELRTREERRAEAREPERSNTQREETAKPTDTPGNQATRKQPENIDILLEAQRVSGIIPSSSDPDAAAMPPGGQISSLAPSSQPQYVESRDPSFPGGKDLTELVPIPGNREAWHSVVAQTKTLGKKSSLEMYKDAVYRQDPRGILTTSQIVHKEVMAKEVRAKRPRLEEPGQTQQDVTLTLTPQDTTLTELQRLDPKMLYQQYLERQREAAAMSEQPRVMVAERPQKFQQTPPEGRQVSVQRVPATQDPYPGQGTPHEGRGYAQSTPYPNPPAMPIHSAFLRQYPPNQALYQTAPMHTHQGTPPERGLPGPAHQHPGVAAAAAARDMYLMKSQKQSQRQHPHHQVAQPSYSSGLHRLSQTYVTPDLQQPQSHPTSRMMMSSGSQDAGSSRTPSGPTGSGSGLPGSSGYHSSVNISQIPGLHTSNLRYPAPFNQYPGTHAPSIPSQYPHTGYPQYPSSCMQTQPHQDLLSQKHHPSLQQQMSSTGAISGGTGSGGAGYPGSRGAHAQMSGVHAAMDKNQFDMMREMRLYYQQQQQQQQVTMATPYQRVASLSYHHSNAIATPTAMPLLHPERHNKVKATP